MAETERDALFQVLDALEALDIPYMVVGSFASTFWGRPRTTHDADLMQLHESGAFQRGDVMANPGGGSTKPPTKLRQCGRLSHEEAQDLQTPGVRQNLDRLERVYGVNARHDG